MFDLPGAYVRDLVEVVARRDVLPAQLLADLPVTAAALAEPTTRVPLRVCEAIVARAHALTGDPALAFHVGMQMRLSSHGFLGFAAMTAGTVREALELAVRFVSTRTSAIGLALYVEGDTAALVIEERTPLAPFGALREFVVIALLVGVWQLGRGLTGHALEGAAECAFPAPSYATSLATAGRMRFARPDHRLVFPSSELGLALPSADAVATRLAVEQCERELSTVMVAGLASRIRAVLAARVQPPSVTALARDLGMSERTLKRRLAEEGSTYSAIRDEHRRQRALLLLDDRTLSIGEVAARLGYTELPNFTRAFRKWTGLTPLAYRARDRG